MTKLKLFSEKEGKSWTLKPNRECIVGSNPDCDPDCMIKLTDTTVAPEHLKFNFDTPSSTWHVHSLNSSDTYINNQQIQSYPIQEQIRIVLTNNTAIVATPEGNQKAILSREPIQTSVPSAPVTSTTHIQGTQTGTNLNELAVREKYINRSFFDREHPEELRGFWLKDFSVSNNEGFNLVHIEKLNDVRLDLYKEVDNVLQTFAKKDGYLQDKLHFRTIEYKDFRCKKKDRQRLYTEIVLDTVRGTKITTLCRFFVHGNNLYLAIDSYSLGRLKKRKLIIQGIILWILAPLLPILFGFFIVPGVIASVYLLGIWIGVFRVLLQGESLRYALRVNFPKDISANSFDLDDSYMYLKSLLPLVIDALKRTLEKHNMLELDMKDYLESISKKIIGQTINVNTGGGGIFGSIIGSLGSKVNNQK